MRKVLLLLTLFTTSLLCGAQSLKGPISVRFDFNHPSTLNPMQHEVTQPSEIIYFIGPGRQSVLYNKSIQLRFHADDDGYFANIYPPSDHFNANSILRTRRGSQMTISANEGDQITRISFYGRQQGGLDLKNRDLQNTYGQYRNVDYTIDDKTVTVGEWTDCGHRFSSVNLINDGADVMLDSIVVTYYANEGSKLNVVSTTLDTAYPLEKFKYEMISFSDYVVIDETVECKIVKQATETEEEVEIPVLLDKVGGHSVVFYTEQVLLDAGSYKLIIPSGAVTSKDGVLKNEDIETAFSIYEKSASANPDTTPYKPGEFDIDEPADPIEIIAVDYTLTPGDDSVDYLETIKVAFDTTEEVTFADAKYIKLASGNGVVLDPVKVEPVDGENNTFLITFSNVLGGEQTLTVASGAFSIGYDIVKGFTKKYYVSIGHNYKTDFLTTVAGGRVIEKTLSLSMPGITQRHFKEDLNAVYLYHTDWKKSGLSVNQNVELPFVGFYYQKTYTKVKLVATTLPDDDAQPAIFIDFGTTITEDDNVIPLNDLYEGTGLLCNVIIPEGTFGDTTFGKYLADANSVDLSDCHVNARYVWSVDLFKKPTGNSGDDTPGTPDNPNPPTPPVVDDMTKFQVVSDVDWTVLVNGESLTSNSYEAEALNDIKFFSEEWNNKDAVVDSNAKVVLRRAGISDTLVVGTLVKEELKQALSTAYVYKFVPDAGQDIYNIPATEYNLVLPKGAIGDAKFGEWLADPSKVKKGECKINDEAKASIKIKAYQINYVGPELIAEKNGVVRGIKISFPEATTVTVTDTAKIVLIQDGKEIEPSDIKVNGNEVEVLFRNLQKGDYVLNITPGSIVVDGRKWNVVYTGNLSVPTSVEVKKDLVKTWKALVADIERNTADTDVEYNVLDLNNIVLYSADLYNVYFFDSKCRVALRDEKGNLTASGQLVGTNVYDEEAGKYLPAYRVVFDRVFRKADFEESNVGLAYKLVVPQAMFGDANYGKSLTDTTISYDECAVNDEFEFILNLFTTPTAINGVNSFAAAPKGTYDLSGRAATNATRGVYVVDGKKVYKK